MKHAEYEQMVKDEQQHHTVHVVISAGQRKRLADWAIAGGSRVIIYEEFAQQAFERALDGLEP